MRCEHLLEQRGAGTRMPCEHRNGTDWPQLGGTLLPPAHDARVQCAGEFLASPRPAMPLLQQRLSDAAQLSFSSQQRRHCTCVILKPVETKRQFVIHTPRFRPWILREITAQKLRGFSRATCPAQNMGKRASCP